MTKFIGFNCIFLLTALSFSTALAQEEANLKRLSIGLNIGVNNAWAKKKWLYYSAGDASTTKINGKFGLTAGMGTKYELSKHINLNGNLSYIQNNYLATSNASFASQEFNEHMSWIELKTGLDYVFTQKNISPYIGLGFSYRYLLNSKAEVNAKYDNGMSTFGELDLSDSRRKSNYLMHLRAGFLFFKNTKVEILYSHGLSSIAEKKDSPPGSTNVFDYSQSPTDYKLRSISLSVSYLVPIQEL